MFIDFKLSLIIFFDCLSILGKSFLEDLFNNESFSGKNEKFFFIFLAVYNLY